MQQRKNQTECCWPRTLTAHGITVRRQPAPEAIADADLVLTIPGTTTLEVAALPVAAIVALPLVLGGAVPAEGMLEWLLRFPLLRALRRLLALDWVTRHHTALPNRLAGRRIVPELVAATPPLVAASAFALLHDAPRRREMEAALAEVAGPRGASGRIAERMLAALAAQRKTAGSAVRVVG